MPEAALYSKSIPIARFSFWNLVGLGEGQAVKEDVGIESDSSGPKKMKTSSRIDVEDEFFRTHMEGEEGAEEEEPESYKRLCYL